MNPSHPFQALMREAARLTQSGRLHDATQALRRALGGIGTAGVPTARRTGHPGGEVLDGCVTEVPGSHPAAAADAPPRPEAITPGRFNAGTHSHAGLTRAYKLYTPPQTGDGRALPLVVMLHGCTQDPDDFAAGTGMNPLAQAQGFYVLYPAQAQDANPQRCWNWFKHNHQQRDRGEPALIAAMTRAVIAEHGIDARRVYIAGLSAGGAMAAIVASAYPELFAAVGVHSGLAPGAATGLPEALAAMRGGSRAPATPRAPGAPAVPTIIFHGDQDGTVHPRNGEQVLAAALAGTDTTIIATPASPTTATGERASRRVTRTVHVRAGGQAQAEHWLVHGAGHAWSGGKAPGSYVDPAGPDASQEMLRFFLAHPMQAESPLC
jgi:poly(hydroxyalkanoate) depolymerase family esterase